MWLTLFWDTRLCFTWERARHTCRRAHVDRENLEQFMRDETAGAESSNESELHLMDSVRLEGPPQLGLADDEGTSSVKRVSMVFCTSPDNVLAHVTKYSISLMI